MRLVAGTTRTNRHSAHPDHGAGKVKRGEEIDSAAVVSCSDAAEMLELVEEALDAVAQLVGDGIVRDEYLARPSGGDDGLCAGFGDEGAQSVAVIGFVGDDAVAREAGEKLGRRGDVVGLAAGPDE